MNKFNMHAGIVHSLCTDVRLCSAEEVFLKIHKSHTAIKFLTTSP